MADKPTSIRSVRDCPYRIPVFSAGTELESASCRLLYELVGTRSAADYRVDKRVCESCCRDTIPNEKQLNPAIASLVYLLSSDMANEARRLNELARKNLRVISARRREDFLPICEMHSTGRISVTEGCLHLVRPLTEVVGRKFHRSGWPYAVGHLQSLACEHGVIFDDYVEQSFCYSRAAKSYDRPWIGVFHHPPQIPKFATPPPRPADMFGCAEFSESLPHLLGGIALSNYLAAYLRDALKVPMEVVRHPSEVPHACWTIERYNSVHAKQLVQLGWYLRNTRAIYQVPKLINHTKIRCLPPREHIKSYDQRVANYWYQQGTRVEYGGVEERGYLSVEDYDVLLSESVVLTEFFDASANNVVVECIARGTPIIVNPHPATVEYLGKDYPLYFRHPADVPRLLEDTDRILSAHCHLAELDKDWLSGIAFRESIQNAVRRIVRFHKGLQDACSS